MSALARWSLLFATCVGSPVAVAGGIVPGPVESGPALAAGWAPVAGWQASEVRFEPDGGTRVGALVTAPVDAPLVLQARGVSEAGASGPWRTVEETWRDDAPLVCSWSISVPCGRGPRSAPGGSAGSTPWPGSC